MAFGLTVGRTSGTASGVGQDPRSLFCPMHPDLPGGPGGRAEVPPGGPVCSKCGMKLVPRPLPPAYACPMHPEVMSPEPGECPRCRMKLERIGQVEPGDFVVRIQTSPAPPVAGEELLLRFAVHHPGTGRPVREFNILHEMPFHLFIVSQDLAHFEHLHPALQADGSLLMATRLPQPGNYLVFCDFFPAGGMPQVSHQHLVTAGYSGDLVSGMVRLTPDTPVEGRLVRVIDGTRFELTFTPATLYAGSEFELRYTILDAATRRPVDDLRPYLAAWGHTLILSEDGTEYLHSHPTEMIPPVAATQPDRPRDGAPLRGPAGGRVVFDTFFPRPGRYRIWSQFQRGARLMTVPFNIDVRQL